MEWADRIGRRLKLRDLHMLMTVVQRGSMAKAAAELAVSQPAVSKAIADMEHTLGLRLLDRSRNGVEPTAYGRALVKRGMTIFDELKQGVEELEFLADPSVGSLRIGSTESIAAGMLPAIIERFCREHPGVRLDVAQTVISTLHYRELRERSIDLLIGRIPTPFAEDDLAADIVYDDQVVVVAGRQSKWARARKLKLADLSGEPWILPSADTMPALAGGRNISYRRRQYAARTRHDAVDSFVLPAGCKRTVHRDAADLDPALWRPRPGSKNSADRSADAAASGRDRDSQKSHTEPGRKAVHRVRSPRAGPGTKSIVS